MRAPAPPSWDVHLTDLGFRTPASPRQGLTFSELVYGLVDLSAILVYEVLLQEKHLMATNNYCTIPFQHEKRVKHLVVMNLWSV